jgi:hypothetical protein
MLRYNLKTRLPIIYPLQKRTFASAWYDTNKPESRLPKKSNERLTPKYVSDFTIHAMSLVRDAPCELIPEDMHPHGEL